MTYYDACADCGIEKTGARRRRQRCRICASKLWTRSPEVCAKISDSQKGSSHSPETRRKMSISRGGDGILENRRYPGLGRWTASVKRTFTCCVVCRSTEDLEAHHIVPKATYPQYATFIFNGVTLCKPCHKEVHGQN